MRELTAQTRNDASGPALGDAPSAPPTASGPASPDIRFRYAGTPYALGDVGAPGDFPEARHDLARIAREVDRDAIASGPASLWRYAAVLPVADPRAAVSLGEGWTPLLALPRLGRALGLPHLHAKDESRNPSGTFKDRGASVALSRLRELGHRTFVHASSGNSGAAWALYAARAGVRCVDLLASDALPAALRQASTAGASVFQLDGPWGRAGQLVAAAAAREGWVDVGALKEPYRLEGKKTMGYEICEQLGWRLPDAVVYPTGGGLGAIAIYKAFAELIELGWIEPAPPPKLIVTQYEGCAPIARAFHDGAALPEPWGALDVPPGGLKSPNPPGGRAVLELLRRTGGTAVTVRLAEAVAAVQDLARSEGILTCPESATTVAGLSAALRAGAIEAGDRAVVVLTGGGLKSIGLLPEPDTRLVTPDEGIPNLAVDAAGGPATTRH